MKYQKFMKKVMEQLTEYKGTVDTLAAAYSTEKAKHEKELKSMQGKYTEEYIEESRRNWKPSKRYAEIINSEREKHQNIANAYIGQIERELNLYFSVPVNPSFASTVTALKTIGAKVSDREFQLLQDTAGGYWDRKLLSALSTSRTEKTDKVKMNDKNEPERTTVDKPIPYFGVELPNIENVYDSLQNVKNAVNMAFNGYCGMNYKLKDVVFPVDKYTEQTNAKLAETYGVQPQKPTLDNISISKMAGSLKCFDESHHSYTAFSETMQGIEAIMPQPKKKTVLTDSDRKLIDTLISPNYPALAQTDAINIAKADSRLAEILSLDERYGAGVRKALGEVSDNE